MTIVVPAWRAPRSLYTRVSDYLRIDPRTPSWTVADLGLIALWAAVGALLVTWRLDMYDHNIFGIDLYYYSYALHHTQFFERLAPASLTLTDPLKASSVSEFYGNIYGNKTALAEHFAPILVALAPLARIFPAPQFLLVLGVVSHFVTGVLVYWLGRELLPGRWLPVAVSVVYGLNPALLASVIEPNGGWYLDSVAPPLVLGAALALIKRRFTVFVVLLVALLAVKPTLPVYAILLGVGLLLCGSRWRLPATASLLGGVLGLILGLAIPQLLEANYSATARLDVFVAALVRPWLLFADLQPGDAVKLLALVALPFSPTLLFPPIVLLVMPELALNIFAGRIFAHNMFTIYAVLAVGTALGVHVALRQSEFFARVAQSRALPLAVVVAGIGALYYAHSAYYRQWVDAAPAPSTIPYSAAKALAQALPADRWIATNVEMGRVLYDRLNWAVADKADADYVLVLTEPVLNPRHARFLDAVRIREEDGRLREMHKEGQLRVLMRTSAH